MLFADNSWWNMTHYVETALLVYEPAAEKLVQHVVENTCGTVVSTLSLEQVLADPASCLAGVGHVVVAACQRGVKQVLRLAMEYGFSVGILPSRHQGKLARYLDLPSKRHEAIAYALGTDAPPMDIVLCNEQIMLFRGSIGWIPLLDAPAGLTKWRMLVRAVRKFARLKLFAFTITTATDKTIRTAASGCMLVQRHNGGLVSDLTQHDSSIRDGAVSLVVTSPISMVEYIVFLVRIFLPAPRDKKLPRARDKKMPRAVGYIKSSELRIEPERAMDVFIDGELATRTPVVCKTLPAAVRVNVGPFLRQSSSQADANKENVKIANLPDDREMKKSLARRIPFFSYASEDRFKDLFMSLREGARVSSSYITLMILSTMLATVGLYLDNAAVIIGAMILAPLMAPLVSASMGLLRADRQLFWHSGTAILLGVCIALATAALTTQAFPHKPVTNEMLGRLNPTLLDLVVAIVSGVAAAYARAYREIAQNLAGVAIAVALVPPLAVAGVGIGRGDLYFFLQAFLLFSTNMVGIILAATFTFRILGFSPVVKGKRGVWLMLLLLGLITVPLYLAYNQIIDSMEFERNLETDRYYVNGKYLVVSKVRVSYDQGQLQLIMELLARGPLTRDDLRQLKRKLESQLGDDVIVQTNIIYLL